MRRPFLARPGRPNRGRVCSEGREREAGAILASFRLEEGSAGHPSGRETAFLAVSLLGRLGTICVRAQRQAGDGTRTRGPQLGKLMLYQLSYTRSVLVDRGFAGGSQGAAGYLPGDSGKDVKPHRPATGKRQIAQIDVDAKGKTAAPSLRHKMEQARAPQLAVAPFAVNFC